MKTGAIAGLALVGLVSAAPGAQAQEAAPSPAPAATVVAARKQIIGEIVTAGLEAARQPIIREPFGSRLTGFQGLLASYLLTLRFEKATYKALLETMESRADKQIGAPASSGGTSLTTKGAVPQILGAAVESGALDRSVNGKVVTFRARPLGLSKFLQSRGILDMYGDYSRSPGARFARRFSASVSFDTALGGSPGSLTAHGDQLSGWSLRGEVVNQRDAALTRYAADWQALLQKGGPFVTAASDVQQALQKWPFFLAWLDALHAEVVAEVDGPFKTSGDRASAAARFRTTLDRHLARLDRSPSLPPEVEAALDAYVAQLTLLEKGIGDIYSFANKGVLLTVEFAAARDAQLPDLYTGTGVLAMGLGAARKTDLTVNAEASYYRSVPPGATQKLKSVAFSAEIAHPLGSVLGLRSATFSVAARYSYLPRDSVTSGAGDSTPSAGGTVAAPKGSIASVQAKLTLPIKGSGIKAPLSITFANRTEAIKEKVVRANFGVTFDLDTLLAASKAAN